MSDYGPARDLEQRVVAAIAAVERHSGKRPAFVQVSSDVFDRLKDLADMKALRGGDRPPAYTTRLVYGPWFREVPVCRSSRLLPDTIVPIRALE